MFPSYIAAWPAVNRGGPAVLRCRVDGIGVDPHVLVTWVKQIDGYNGNRTTTRSTPPGLSRR